MGFDNLLAREALGKNDKYGVNVVLFMLKSMYFNASVRLPHIFVRYADDFLFTIFKIIGGAK